MRNIHPRVDRAEGERSITRHSPVTRPRHRVVIVGGGFGGLAAAKALRHAPVDVTVVDRTNHHLMQPLLHQVAAGILSEGDVARPIREVLRDQRNVGVALGEVVDIDLARRHVTIDTIGQRDRIQYDSLIVAAGARQSYFGHAEFEHEAPGMKTIDDALELRGRIFGAFEMAERETDPAARSRWLTFVVIGAGPTGVELAGQIAELSRRSLGGTYRRIDPAGARVVLLSAAPAILASFPEALRDRAARDLRDLGVEIHVATRVINVDKNGIETDAIERQVRRVDAATKIWAAGVEASPLGRVLANASGATLDRGGRVQVEPDCSLQGHPEVFVIGDLMSLDQLPGVTQVAIQSGRHVAGAIARRVGGDITSRPFRYHDSGTMATISRLRAVGMIGTRPVSGVVAWLLWLSVRMMMLTGFKTRLSVVMNWTVAFLGRGRAEPVITAQQVFARHALTAHRQRGA